MAMDNAPATISNCMGVTMATGRERMAAHRKRKREGITRLDGIELKNDEIRETAGTGYADVLSGGAAAVKALNDWSAT
jgi:hypothetical protein